MDNTIDYKKAAADAVAYVAGKMRHGASNKLGDVFTSGGASLLCVTAMRSVTGEYLATKPDRVRYVERLAATAEHTGCGNCGEQAALAMIWLRDQGVVPIDMMMLKNGDHGFVVLGRPDKSDLANFRGWGPNCQICDPWEGKSYPAARVSAEMTGGGVFLPELLLRYH